MTTPLKDPTVATTGLPLVHEPPGTESVSVTAVPVQRIVGPEIDEGSGLTVIEVVVIQVEPREKVIVATPVVMPVTMPVEPTVAILLLLLLQVPPPTSLSVVVDPKHTFGTPVIGVGEELTDKVVCALHPVARV